MRPNPTQAHTAGGPNETTPEGAKAPPFMPAQAVAQYQTQPIPPPPARPSGGSPSKGPGGLVQGPQGPGMGPGQGAAPGAPPKRPSLFAKLRRPLVILALGGAAYGAYLYRARHMPYEWTGTVEAKTVQVGSRTGGRVKDIHVREGEEVKAGQLLVTLEPHDLLAQRSAAEAELAVAEATLAKLQHGARPQEIEEARAKLAAQSAAVSQAQLRAAHESAELRRTQAMVEGRALAKAELDAHKAATGAAEGETAQAVARASEARAALALLTGGTRDEDLRVGEAAVASARAKLLGLGIAITELEVRAARDARVESMNVRPGNLLAANAPAVTLLETGEVYVRVYVPETLVGRLKIGQAVPISVDSFPDRTFRGKVEHVSAVGEYTPRNLTTIDDRANEVFAARVGLLEGQTELRAGMVANIHVPK